MRCWWHLLCLLISRAAAEKLRGFKPLRSDVYPSLLGIGIAKSGTTDLYSSLIEGLPGYFNEPERKEANDLLLHTFERPEAREAYKRDLHFDGGKPYTLDITPLYFWSQRAVQHAKTFLPESNTVIMLRDPVATLHSMFNWRKGQQELHSYAESLSLASTILAELQLVVEPARYLRLLSSVLNKDVSEGMAQYSQVSRELDKMLTERNANASNAGQGFVLMPLMLPPLRAWNEHFKEGRTLVILSDSYYRNKTDVFLNAVLPFVFGDELPKDLDVDDMLSRLKNMSISNSQRYTKDLPAPLSCMLHTFYEPFNCLLADFLRSNPKIQVYPPERLNDGCSLWENTNMLKACKLDHMVPTLTNLEHSVVPHQKMT